MNNDDLRNEKRKLSRLEKLGTDTPICPHCGESDWRCMELHHVAGQARDPSVVLACANCHRKLTDDQQDHPAIGVVDDTLLDTVGHFLLGVADMLRLIFEKLREFGQAVITRAGGEPRPAPGRCVMNSATEPLTNDRLVISLRAYAESSSSASARNNGKGQEAHGRKATRPFPRPSDWVLVFDTETSTDAGQSLRIGSYQVREGDRLHEVGLFYEPAALSVAESATLADFSVARDLRLITREEFVERIFYGIGYELRATIVGFNLPFDLSRFGGCRSYSTVLVGHSTCGLPMVRFLDITIPPHTPRLRGDESQTD
jgi:hypothetical protein